MLKHEFLRNKKFILTYLLIFISLFFILFLSSCSVFEVVGSGKVTSEERQVSSIESILIGSSMNYKGSPKVNSDISSSGSLNQAGNSGFLRQLTIYRINNLL